MLGLLGGIAFALFYATFGIPIAAWADRSSRRNVLASRGAHVVGHDRVLWPCHYVLVAAAGAHRHSDRRSRWHAAFALTDLGLFLAATARNCAFPLCAGGALRRNGRELCGRMANEFYGWRHAFILVALPGLLVALLVRFTIVEPPRGHAGPGSGVGRGRERAAHSRGAPDISGPCARSDTCASRPGCIHSSGTRAAPGMRRSSCARTP